MASTKVDRHICGAASANNPISASHTTAVVCATPKRRPGEGSRVRDVDLGSLTSSSVGLADDEQWVSRLQSEDSHGVVQVGLSL